MVFHEVSGALQKCSCRFQEHSNEFKDDPWALQWVSGMFQGSSKYLRQVLRRYGGFQEIPRDFKGFQTVSVDFRSSCEFEEHSGD